MVEKNKYKDSLVKKIDDKIARNPKVEHLLNVFKAILASFPIGASVSSLLTDYIPNTRLKRIEEFAMQVAEDLKKLRDKVDNEYITTDEFAYIFQESFQGVAQNYQKEKIQAFRGILINSAIHQDYPQDEKEYFLHLVNNLSVLHIKILKFLAYPEDYLKEIGIEPSSIMGGFSQIFSTLMPEVSLPIIESAFGDLFQMGLIGTDKKIFHTITSAAGLNLVGNRVNELGMTFLDFCKSPIE